MYRLLLPVLILSTMVSGCITISPPGSTSSPSANGSPPTAYIDSITPEQATEGDLVSIDGHGTDPDGQVVAYEWRSSLNGTLSTVASFQTSSLSVGSHTIYLKVRDNTNQWSVEVSKTIVVNAKVEMPVITSFSADPASIIKGEFTTLSWSVAGAETVVTIDNGLGTVPLEGTTAAYPSASVIYTLTATNIAGSVTATASVEVLEPRTDTNPVIHFFTPRHLGGTQWELSWSVSDATSIVIEPEIGPVDPVGSTVINAPITASFVLTATNDWGWAKHQITIGYE